MERELHDGTFARAGLRAQHRARQTEALRLALGASLACLVGLPLPASTQEPPPRAFAGAELILASPTGEFAENVGLGGGVAGHLGVFLNEGQNFALRADAGFINYGSETIRICVVLPCRVTGDLTTSNNIVFGGIGPEIGVGTQALRIYGNATIGFAYFGTTSSVEGAHQDGDPFASSTNFDDGTFAWTSGVGARFQVRGGRMPVRLSVAVRYHGNGQARYLRKGDIEDQPDGSVVLNPQDSDTNLWTYHLGVSIGVPEDD